MANNYICAGILAHVDAGKTTLAEGMLYLSGNIRKLGRVDHGNTFLDNFELERSRGITIFSKQAEITWKEKQITLLDTPGHVDFSAEMERTLRVLDYAILVIGGMAGVQGHVQTLWKLLKQYEIPVFLFINKMDQDGADRETILAELQKRLDGACVDFSVDQTSDEFYENVAMCDEKVLEHYLENGEVEVSDLKRMIQKRKVFPCYFGSALRMEGVEAFLDQFDQLTLAKSYPEEFGAKVYKISRDKQGARLTHLKITGGSLKVKSQVKEDKVDQIRIYSGTGFELAQEIEAGRICTVTGLSDTYCGEGLGIESVSSAPILEPVLTYQIILPEGSDVHTTFTKLKQLEEEQPELHIVWNTHTNEIYAQVMGEIQIEILQNIILERFQMEVSFGTGSIVYRETIEAPVEGAGHYEPLRHYSEVRLWLEPLERGAGMEFDVDCSEDILDKNWQRLIFTHLLEKKHKGVLTGSEITDMRITLINGRAHLKHTEGGDFRQSTYRAVRQGLRRAKSILLEPIYEFQLEVPSDMIGRAMSDVQRMCGTFESPTMDGEYAILTGTAPVATMRDYQKEVVAYSRGLGRLFLTQKGYEPCHNAEEVIDAMNYDPEADLENPTGSVFCAHGAGFVVNWDEVENYMHTESRESQRKASVVTSAYVEPPFIDEEELQEIFERTYGKSKRERYAYDSRKSVYASSTKGEPIRPERYEKKKEPVEEYLLVDGYNIIFAWDDLKELSKVNIEGARGKLMDILSNYQGYKKNTVILVFDGYKVQGNVEEVMKYHNIYVVYTKEAETADQYIEKTVQKIGRKHNVMVATSDALEQMIILGQGAQRIPARELREQIEIVNQEIREEHIQKTKKMNPLLFDHLPEDMAELMNDVRMGRRTFGDEGKDGA
ncbi:MAG: TetM/TetW/TetO/TetS family tetracycline resistance ribosomal protection protein [Lachnospiraceae bacterium]|nr:TetM/TetW/TetO/TetS family tetracycline resistance ribosomal protection protein [Lachnospiraceae bacterium]